MSDIFNRLARSERINEQVDPVSDRILDAWNRAETDKSPIIHSWDNVGLEDIEWAQLTDVIGRLLVPKETTLSGSVIAVPAYKYTAATIVFSEISDWQACVPENVIFEDKDNEDLAA